MKYCQPGRLTQVLVVKVLLVGNYLPRAPPWLTLLTQPLAPPKVKLIQLGRGSGMNHVISINYLARPKARGKTETVLSESRPQGLAWRLSPRACQGPDLSWNMGDWSISQLLSELPFTAGPTSSPHAFCFLSGTETSFPKVSVFRGYYPPREFVLTVGGDPASSSCNKL